MRTFATKQPSNQDSAHQKPVRTTPKPMVRGRRATASSSLFPGFTGSTMLQRKPRCACGGGCPRCQEEALLQSKLKISEPGDEYEQEADRIADEVMRMPEPQVQRQVELEEEEEEEDMVQRQAIQDISKPLHLSGLNGSVAAQFPFPNQTARIQRQEMEEEEEETLQTKRASSTTLNMTPGIEAGIQSLRGGGQPLASSVRAFFEPRFGYDFSHVKIHTNAHAAELARAVHARAFTVGRDVVLGTREYAPETVTGRRLLAHELTHVIQQSNGGELLQKAEVDDNPAFCFPKDGRPALQDVGAVINGWIAKAQANGQKKGESVPTAIFNELGVGWDKTYAEKQIANLSGGQVRQISYEEGRYNITEFVRNVWYKGQPPLAPVINLCGFCVGSDKVGHFFQQGYEYLTVGEALRQRIQTWTPEGTP